MFTLSASIVCGLFALTLRFKITPKKERTGHQVHVDMARDKHALKSLTQNVHCGRCCVAMSAVLLEPHVVGIHIIQLKTQKGQFL